MELLSNAYAGSGTAPALMELTAKVGREWQEALENN